MTSVTTNFTLDELRHILVGLNAGSEPHCELCSSARRKIEEAIELAEIVEANKDARNR